MFQFRRFPSYAYLIQRRILEYCSSGFPHSEISGSMRMCRSPKLIAACHVLLQLLMPRHSPCALISLTYCKRPFGSLLHSTNYAGSRLVHCSVLPFIIKVSTFQDASLSRCYLSVACSQYFESLLFSFQGAASNLFQGQIEIPDPSGTSIQAQTIEVFFAYFLFQKKVGGGPKWTRTTDLTIISRTL